MYNMRISYWILAREKGHLWSLFLYGETEIVTNVYPFKFDWIGNLWFYDFEYIKHEDMLLGLWK